MSWAPPRLSLSRADTGTYRRTGGQKSLFSTAFKRNAEKQQHAAVTPQDVGNSRTDKTPVIRGEITLFFQQHANLPCRGMTTCKTSQSCLEEATQCKYITEEGGEKKAS